MWYYVRNSQRIGPVDESTVATLVQNGTIVRQTPVWREGMADWQQAAQTDLKTQFADVPPARPSYSGLTTYTATHESYTARSFRNLWLWFAWLVGAGFPLCPVIVGIVPFIAGSVIGFILLYRYWALIQDGKARTSPGKAVGFCFIPFFNFYWLYVAFVGLSKDLNLYCDERQTAGPRVSEGLALTWFILFFCTMIPYVGWIAVSIAFIVILIILMKQYTDVAMRLVESRSDRTTA
jgi:hypothetical protein